MRLGWFVCGWLALSLLGGCYLHHEGEGDVRGADGSVDAALDATIDAGVDASADSAVDAGPDAAMDAGTDGAIDAGDAGAPCDVRVPDDYPTLQQAIDETRCARILVTQDLLGPLTAVTRSVTIASVDGVQRALRSDGSGRVLGVGAGVDVVLERLVIADGVETFGGGIYSVGNLTLRDVTLQNNLALGDGTSPSVGGGGLAQIHGLLTMEGEVVFEGNRVEASSAGSAGAIFLGGTATFERLVLHDNHVVSAGSASGGAVAILNGALTGDTLIATNNSAVANGSGSQQAAGGAISIGSGVLSAREATFTTNTVSAGLAEGSGTVAANGGAVFCGGMTGRVALMQGTAQGNVALALNNRGANTVQAAGGFLSSSCETTVSDFVVESNRAQAEAGSGTVARALGGAIASERVTAIARSTLRRNGTQATSRGSAPPTGLRRDTASWSYGGALAVGSASSATVRECLITDNEAALTALDERGANDAAGGGAIVALSLFDYGLTVYSLGVERTSLVSNHVRAASQSGRVTAHGGAMLLAAHTVVPFEWTVTHSTLADNSVNSEASEATARGGAIAVDSAEGPAHRIALSNVTITENNVTAPSPSGATFAVTYGSDPAPLDITHSIVWANKLHGQPTLYDCESPVLRGDNNLIFDLACFVTPGTNNRALDPLLGPLQTFGERCVVQPIPAQSPAHDSGGEACPVIAGTDATQDQCGTPRRSACDLGAVEATR